MMIVDKLRKYIMLMVVKSKFKKINTLQTKLNIEKSKVNCIINKLNKMT